ncbi:PAS domain S-box protein [Acaryochloris sp. IP29b_bin.148]|uniref:PAS domain-containing sensor histidine kinase n=1 Tax=Acaryochloris sp. IP29b_bin.148 TaxID=2969218 RepID=UPI00260AB6DD|nr:PAS domain S-box protein [Acaryochloris sp. IP29b_bin.148]
MDWHFSDNVMLSYIPHGHCYLWKTNLVSLHAISDALIALAYFSIPCTLGYFVFKRKDLPYPWIFALFGLFIVSCGITHVLEIWTLWYPTYWLSGTAKALTATVSLFTSVQLFPIVPQALSLKSPTELETANQALKQEIADRQRIEAELHQSQQLLNNAFELALIGKALLTPEGDWIRVNSALCKLFGYSEAELLQTNFRAITYPEDLAADQQYVEQLLTGELSACQFEKRYIHKQGHIIWTVISVSVVRNAQGQLLNCIAEIQDITEQKQAEQELRFTTNQLELAVKKRTAELEQAYTQLQESEAQYQDLYNNAPDMYVSVDAKSKNIIRCNQTLINELGYRQSEVLGRPIFAMYHPDCLPQVEEAFQTFMETGEVKDAQLVLQRKDGSPLDVSLNVRAIRDKTGKILYSRSSWRDITERKQLEAQLQQINVELEQRVDQRTQDLIIANGSLKKSQEQLEVALEASGDGWWHWHVQTGDLDWSPMWYHMLGYKDNELPACYETWASLVHPEDMTWVKDILNAHLQDNSVPYAFDYRVLTKDGEWKWIANMGKVVERDSQGQPLRMAGMHHDISDRKQAEQQLQQLNFDLLRSNQELSQFAYVASHDLQEPLRKVRNFTDLLAARYQGELDESADRYIRYITDGATRMQGLIGDLLSYSRIGRTNFNIQTINLEATLQQVKSDLETVIQDRQAMITAEALPSVSADPVQMRQLLQNLLTNAIKYCQADVPTVRIWATQDHENWTISVQDNGIGIDPQFAERIFVIFQRLHNKDAYSGSGIGLAICKKIVERHGGQIWVDSQEGQGSTFSFTLPITCRLASSED